MARGAGAGADGGAGGGGGGGDGRGPSGGSSSGRRSLRGECPPRCLRGCEARLCPARRGAALGVPAGKGLCVSGGGSVLGPGRRAAPRGGGRQWSVWG